MKNLLIILLPAILFISCDKPITLDLKENESKIVIDGLLTNRPNEQYIKISKTADFYSNGKTPRVTTAIVTVKDDAGHEYIFKHKADSAGFYFPETPFVGEIGRKYHLTVVAEGETYEAEEELFSVIPIDKLEYEFDKDEAEADEPEEEGKFYRLLLFATEPQETKDYYLFKFYRNDSLKFSDENDIYYSDDELLAENIDGVEGPIYYAPGDKAKVEAYSITRSGYVFFSDLQTLLNNDGGLFGSPPANCRNNLSNGALGFFQVSAVNSSEILVE